jgi:hypothetical protein
MVEVFTPEGRFIGSRAPMNGWMMNKPRLLGKHKKMPRRSMKGAKKREKLAKRAANAMAKAAG